jgi:hypothetical protein
MLKNESARNATKPVPLRPSRLPDSGGIFTSSNGVRMEKISRSVRKVKQAKFWMLTVPVRTVRTDTCQSVQTDVACPYGDMAVPEHDMWQRRMMTCGSTGR